ncbi:hypothetical protein FSP39_002003 [Pinctada imbricata]|uniref:Mediator of RNA polymerase II transcription subunit 1 n=1 Tax=Pinctada imbricata TaxID=66713 RepID=A0AA89CDP7_PINIB|nr:hypothetical protein FSP39_002003 [Pinctada imbricata]
MTAIQTQPRMSLICFYNIPVATLSKKIILKREKLQTFNVTTNETKKILTTISTAFTIEHQIEHRRTPSKLEVGLQTLEDRNIYICHIGSPWKMSERDELTVPQRRRTNFMVKIIVKYMFYRYKLVSHMCIPGRYVSPEKHDELKKLMMKLKRGGANRNWTDSLKRVSTMSNVCISGSELISFQEKRKLADGLEQAQIEGCIDKLHCAIKVDSQQTLLERLKSIARPLDLTFDEPSNNNKNAVIRSKMFKVDISINAEGSVRDVRITHYQGDPMSCEDMVEALSHGNFEEFSQHLQGLMDIYRIPGDISMKSKAYLALECLENDLNCLAQLQSSIKGVANCIHKSPLGILLPRKGGCPMKLIYFVSPYDLLNKNTKFPHPMTVEAITDHGLGQSVTVSIEEYPMIKQLQSMPLMSVISKDGKSLPKFQALTGVNSVELPASFVLVLPQPIPVAMSLVQSIQSATGLDVVTVGKENSLLNLVLQQSTKGKLSPSNEFFVTLPDQQHVYYMSDVSGNSLDQQAVLVTRIPFTHPTSVAQVLNILRQQLMFNTVVGSCIRPYAKQDLARSVVFELAAMSLQHFTVMFEHPLQDTMVTAEMDLTDITNAKFRVCIGEEGETICSDDAASKVFQRCLSIPVTLRSVIFKVSEELKREPTPEPQPLPMEISPSFPYTEYLPRLSPRIPFSVDSKGMLQMPSYGPVMMNQPIGMKSPPIGGGYSLPPPHIGSMLPPEPPVIEQERPSSNPLLATLLDQDSPEPDLSKANDTPVLSKLLEDTNSNAQSTTSLASSVPHPPQTKSTRGRPPKRPRSQSEATKGKSPKIHSDVDHLSSSFDSDSHHMRQNSLDSDLHSQGSVGSRQHHPSGASTSSTGSTGGTTVIDLTKFANESPMAILEHMSDNYIPKGGGPMSQHPDNTDVFMVSDIHNHFDSGKDHDSQNFPNTFPNTVPKNEARSTSLEGILSGSGEVSRTKDLHSPISRLNSFEGGNPNSSSILNSLMRSNSHKNSVLQRQLSMDSNSSFGLSRSLSFQSDSDTSELRTSNSDLLMDTGGLNTSKSCDNSDILNSSAMVSSKRLSSSNSVLESPTRDVKNSDLRQLLMEGKKERINNIDKDIKIKSEEGKIKMTIPNTGFFTRPNSSELLDITGGKGTKSSEDTFDFNSDDDEMFHDSPNRLSSKAKNSKLYQSKISKSDKYKKKESKSNDSGKRKRDKYEKQEKKYKKKKVSEDNRSSSVEMYSATPVESEDKTSTKLKIFKNNLGISVDNSPKHSPSNREKDKSELSKKLSSKEERRSSTESLSVKKSSSSQKSSKSVQKSSSITMSRADSKLMNKTPTIKLKPIAIPSSASSMAPSRIPPTASSPTAAKSQTGSGTPTSTTIGRIGAVSLATSGNSKTGTMTPPPSVGSVKVSTPTSAKTPPSVNKSIYSSNKTSSLSTSAKSSERKLSQSGSGRVSSSSSKFSNGSTKHSGERKGGSPSVSGSRNTQMSSSKSHNSSSKGQSSTSQAFGKTSITNPANVLSFLTNEKGIASLPRIPKISSATVNSSKTASTTATTVTMVTSISSTSSSAKMMNSTQTTNSNMSTSRTTYSTGSSYSSSNSKSPINSSLKSPLVGNFNNQVKSGNSSQQGPSKPSNPLPLNRPPNIAPNNLGIRSASSGLNFSQSKNLVGGKSPSSSNPNNTINKANPNQGYPNAKPNNSTATSIVILSKSSSSVQSVKSSTTVAPTSILKQPVSTVVTSSVKATPSVSTSHTEPQQRKPNVTSPTFSISNPVCTAVNPASSVTSGGNTPSKSKSRKNSLSAVIDKLTSAKSHVPSNGEGDEKKNKLEHSDSFEDYDSVKNDHMHKMSEAVDGSSFCKKSSELVEKSGAQTKTGSSENESSSVSKGDVSKVSAEGAAQKNSHQGVNKDTKIDDNSRNLFTSILKNATGSFVPENYKDDKENERQNSKCESRSDEPGVVDLCKKVASPKPSPKQNGPTEHLDSAKSTKDIFKVPTPKSVGTDEKDLEDTENLVVRRKQRISTSKPALSPASDASSPENLIIDFPPASPRTLQNRTNSPFCNVDLTTTPDDVKRVNNSSVKVCKVISSPLSKSNQPLQNNTSPNVTSPAADVEIDDELMNAAIMGFND